jgi:S1-C subfamily serine protease
MSAVTEQQPTPPVPPEPTAAVLVEAAAGPRHRSSGLRLGLAAGALVLVTAAASVTTATLVERGSTSSANAAPSTSTQGTATTLFPADGGYGYVRPGLDTLPGTSPGTSPGTTAGTSPGVTGAAAETSTTATDAQTEGLVEITSTLTDGTAAGTGLVLSSDGTIVTNHHVVAGATGIAVRVVSTGATYRARYIGGDAAADVAVLRLVGASGLTPVDLSSSAAATGDDVVAVGDAGGDGGTLTASTGTVTATDQAVTVRDDSGGSARLTGLLELAAYVVPGDSGGAVLDSAGAVVGMNVAASSGAGAVTGYAIPVAQVRSVAAEILSGRQSSAIDHGYHGFLGIGLDPATAAARVVGVEAGGPADDAGVVAGDTITSVAGTTARTATRLRALLAAHAPGDRVTLTWTTAGGTSRSATVTLARAPIA